MGQMLLSFPSQMLIYSLLLEALHKQSFIQSLWVRP